MIDGFPLTRENWASMIESNLLPDFVLHFEDSPAPPDYLLKRFTDMHGLPFPRDNTNNEVCTMHNYICILRCPSTM